MKVKQRLASPLMRRMFRERAPDGRAARADGASIAKTGRRHRTRSGQQRPRTVELSGMDSRRPSLRC
jgi:hypothetical protein